MHRCTTRQFVWGSFVALAGMLSCEHVTQAEEKTSDPVTTAFYQADKNHNQQLTLEEYLTRPGDAGVLKRDFHLFDFDGDQQLTPDEFAAIPGLVPAAQRGAIPDPYTELLGPAIASMDASYNNWDQHPDVKIFRMTFVRNYTASLSPTGKTSYYQFMVMEADENNDGQTSRKEAKRFLEIQLGIRGPKGHLLNEPSGRVAKLITFLWADKDSDDHVSLPEFKDRWIRNDSAEKTFQRGDLDGDEKISYTEFLNPEWIGYEDPIEAFRKADQDLDGLISPEELDDSLSDSRKVLVSMTFPAMDDDGDGKLSLNEYRLSMLGNRLCSWNTIPADSNRDRKLSFEEFKFSLGHCHLLWRLYFHRFDTNGDGELSHDEYAFTYREPNAFQSIALDGSNLHQIYINPEYPSCGSPDVSPDGKQILFDCYTPETGLGGSRIFLMSIDGKNARNLCDGLMPTWSPDQKQFACSRNQDYGVWIMNIDGSPEKKIADGWGAQWSPDGKTIGFAARNGSFSAYDVETGEIREVLSRAKNPYSGGFWNMNWSPDSQRFAFKGAAPNGKSVIASIKMHGDDPDLQTHFETTNSFDQDITWAPDGDHIYFSMRPFDRKVRLIHVLDLKSKEPPQPIPGFEGKELDCFVAVFIPDGKGLIVGTIERH